MLFAEALTCDNTDICATGAKIIMAVALIAGVIYCLIIAATILVFRKSKKSNKIRGTRKWLWYLWFLLLAAPGIIWLSSLLLP
jgi:hypothetical protein